MDDMSEVADYVWSRVEPTLQSIVDSVVDRNTSVTTTILRLPTKRMLSGYAGFLTAAGASIDKEDVVISVSCIEEGGGIRCGSDISIETDPRIALDGPVAHFRVSDESQFLEAEVRAWIMRTQDFLLQHRNLIVGRLIAKR